mmetsp:Transcript_11981/g.18275  ORF Transcript_11981/g.18275 Transcript_11981/m.18275 type:complete len:98 (+) Transcript_11981:65-358(+)
MFFHEHHQVRECNASCLPVSKEKRFKPETHIGNLRTTVQNGIFCVHVTPASFIRGCIKEMRRFRQQSPYQTQLVHTENSTYKGNAEDIEEAYVTSQT